MDEPASYQWNMSASSEAAGGRRGRKPHSCLLLCRRGESNPHTGRTVLDFESSASANSATSAFATVCHTAACFQAHATKLNFLKLYYPILDFRNLHGVNRIGSRVQLGTSSGTSRHVPSLPIPPLRPFPDRPWAQSQSCMLIDGNNIANPTPRFKQFPY